MSTDQNRKFDAQVAALDGGIFPPSMRHDSAPLIDVEAPPRYEPDEVVLVLPFDPYTSVAMPFDPYLSEAEAEPLHPYGVTAAPLAAPSPELEPEPRYEQAEAAPLTRQPLSDAPPPAHAISVYPPAPTGPRSRRRLTAAGAAAGLGLLAVCAVAFMGSAPPSPDAEVASGMAPLTSQEGTPAADLVAFLGTPDVPLATDAGTADARPLAYEITEADSTVVSAPPGPAESEAPLE